MPLRGGMLLGVGPHRVRRARRRDYEYLRLEPRADGVYYVAMPSGQKEAAFKLADSATERQGRRESSRSPIRRTNSRRRIIYRRGTEGWLYATIEGKLKGEERKVIYPMRRIDCETGEFIRK